MQFYSYICILYIKYLKSKNEEITITFHANIWFF